MWPGMASTAMETCQRTELQADLELLEIQGRKEKVKGTVKNPVDAF